MTPTKTLDFTRDLPLDPDRLWPVLTEPEHRETWGAPEEGMVLTMENADTREGGRERHRCGPAEAPDFLVETRWYRLAAPDLAVFTETLFVGDDRIFTSLVTYSVTPEGTGSRLQVAVAVSSFTGPEAFDEIEQGWMGGLANLDALVERLMSDA
ncbi:MAG: SRPBCC domain-containing protein [Pseudomonadota bacterium]